MIELTTGGKNLTEVKIQIGIYKGDVLLLFLFVITMMPFNLLLRKCTGGHNLHKFQEKSQPPNVHGGNQTAYKNEKELETVV